jgi:hypothetical protein
MTTFGKVQKIYELRSLGYDQLVKEQETIIVNFNRIGKAKRDAAKDAEVAAKSQGVESEAYKQASAAYEQAKLKAIELRTEQKNISNEMRATQNVRQAEINQQKIAAQSNGVEANSINALRREKVELNKSINAVPIGSDVPFRSQILSYDQAIAKLKQLTIADQDYRRQFTRDGLLVGEYTSGIVQSFKQMGLGELIGGQITQANTKLKQLNSTFDTLKAEFQQVKTTGQGSLDVIERKLLENRQEALQLQQQVNHLSSEFRGMGSIGNQITSGIASGFNDMKNQLAQFVLGYLGFQALLSGTQKLIHQNYELSDSIARIKIYTKGTTDEVLDLVDSLKKLDTRTSLASLTDIATIVAKKGVAKDEIVGVTQALDQLFVVLGKEAGDPHEAVASLVKLVNVYSEDKHVTAKNIGDIGAAIAKLTSSGVATGRFLIGFSERMAGIRGITGITIDKVLGLGAALEELGQRQEVSATALSQLMVKLFTNTDKFARITGKSVAEFNQLLRDSPIDAFVLVAEKLKGNAGEMEKFFEGISEIGARGGRVIGVLGDIAGNAEYAKKRMADATKALGDQAALTAAFTEKNKTFAATLDQISKKFELLGSNRSLQLTLSAIASVILLLLGNIPTLLVLLTLWTTGWAILNKEMFLAKANLLLINAQILVSRIALAAITIITNAYAISVALLSGAYQAATIAAGLFNRIILLTPLGIILTLVGLTAGAFAAFAGAVSGTTDKVLAHAAQLKLLIDVQNKVQQQTGATVNKITLLSGVVRDGNVSLSSRSQALKDLIAIAPEYLDKLTLENLKTAEGKHILDGYIVSLQQKAELQAGESIANKAIEERTRLEKTLFDLELKRKQGKDGKNDLTEEEKQFLSTARGSIPFGAAIASTFGGGSTVDAAIKGVKAQIAAKTAEIEQANTFVKEKYKQLGKTVADGQAKVPPVKLRTINVIKDEIKSLDDAIENAEVGSAALKKLVEDRKKLQKELDDAEGKTKDKPAKASRLTAIQRDDLKEIDAARDKQLADDKLRFAKGEIDEATHLQNVLHINQEAIDKKLSLLKGKNAEEKKVIAELQLDRIDQERQTNENLFKLRETELKDQLEQTKKNAELAAKEVADNPTATDTEKAQAKLDSDKAILQAQNLFNNEMDALELKLSVTSKKNAEDRAIALKQINADMNKDQLAVSKASISDMQKQTDAEISAYKATIEKQRAAILSSNKSTLQKGNLTETLDKAEKIGVLAREVNSMQEQLPVYKQLLDEKKITDKEYTDFLAQLYEKQGQLFQATTDAEKSQVKGLAEAAKGAIAKAFGTSDEVSAAIYEALAGGFDLAKDAMNNYFDAERNRINESKEATLERLDVERERVLSMAQSKAEEDRINKQYDLKKKQADKEAGRQLKEVKKKEAKLALATELANIAAAAAANIYNGATFGAAGAIQYAVLSALALGKYAIRVGEINNTQFKYGGSPDVPTSGGRFKGKSHSQGGTPFTYKGNTFEAEVDELAVIRTKNAPTGNYTISGNHTQIASTLNRLGGGKEFAPGGKINKFEYGGGLGESLQAPVFTPSVSSTIINSANTQQQAALIAVTEVAKAIQAVNGRIDRLEVVQVTSTVTSAQKKQAKQSNIGTL